MAVARVGPEDAEAPALHEADPEDDANAEDLKWFLREPNKGHPGIGPAT